MGNVQLLLSGGVDSAVCLHIYKQLNCNINCIFYDYGQNAAVEELMAAKMIADHFAVPLDVVTKTRLLKKEYNGHILGRNAFLLFSALMDTRFDTALISIGIHAGTPYLDCEKPFVDRMQSLYDMYGAGMLRRFPTDTNGRRKVGKEAPPGWRLRCVPFPACPGVARERNDLWARR